MHTFDDAHVILVENTNIVMLYSICVDHAHYMCTAFTLLVRHELLLHCFDILANVDLNLAVYSAY